MTIPNPPGPARTTVEFPAGERFRSVPRLVLGGVAARFELPIDRVDDLLLAVESLLMSTVITALNVAYDRDDRRGFVRARMTALGLGVAVGAAVLLAGTLLVMVSP